MTWTNSLKKAISLLVLIFTGVCFLAFPAFADSSLQCVIHEDVPDSDISDSIYGGDEFKTISYETSDSVKGSVSCDSEPWYIDDSTSVTGSEAIPNTGYRFVCWTDEGGTPVCDTASFVPECDTGNYTDRIYTAVFEAITYSISYELDEGTVSGVNPANYTIETADFTLIAPEKNGYVFTGWTGSNGNAPEPVVTVCRGSYGNLNYTANWEPATYLLTIHYRYPDGGMAAPDNVSEVSYLSYYSVTSPVIEHYSPDYVIVMGYIADHDTEITVTYSPNLESITVIPPKKLRYYIGEELDTEGMKVTAHYYDDSTDDVTEQSYISGYDSSKYGTEEVTVSYREQSAVFEVEIIPRFYVITRGDGGTWERKSGVAYSITCDGDYNAFRSLRIDDVEVSRTMYFVKEGSTVVELRAPYLDSLSLGKHTVQLIYKDGSSDIGTFTIVLAPGIPKTGDNRSILRFAALFLVSGSLLAVSHRRRRKIS